MSRCAAVNLPFVILLEWRMDVYSSCVLSVWVTSPLNQYRHDYGYRSCIDRVNTLSAVIERESAWTEVFRPYLIILSGLVDITWTLQYDDLILRSNVSLSWLISPQLHTPTPHVLRHDVISWTQLSISSTCWYLTRTGINTVITKQSHVLQHF